MQAWGAGLPYPPPRSIISGTHLQLFSASLLFILPTLGASDEFCRKKLFGIFNQVLRYWGKLPMGSDSILSVTISGCCHDSLLCAAARLFLSSLTRRALRDASTRRVSVLKCQTHRCCCQLLWLMIFIRRKQLSPPESGVSLGAQVESDKIVREQGILFEGGT